MSSETQLFRLFDLLKKAGEVGVTKADIVVKLGVKETSVPVYIHSLKKKYKAEIKNVTEGRVVTGYVLTNEPNVPQFKRAATPLTKKGPSTASAGEAPILDANVSTEYSETEVADIGSALGVSGGSYSQDY